ncbi:MAG: glutamate racemase [Elusimicrobiota bacterium]
MISTLNNAPIGVFDSGVGGLTVYREIRKLMPFENIIYFGDTMRVPYGNKSEENIKLFAMEISEFLVSRGVKMIVVACNTVSSIALELIKNKTKLPVVGVIKPGVDAAIARTKNKAIIVIGTRATINSHSYLNEIKTRGDFSVVEKACPLFVPLVEENFIEHKATALIAETYLGEFRKSIYDTIILGCTHYPLLKKVIEKTLKDINIVDSSQTCAKYVKKMLDDLTLASRSKKNGWSDFYVSDKPQNFMELAYRFAGVKICKINIKKF